MKVKTIIADDEPLARERLRSLLRRDADIEIVEECRNGREVVATLKSRSVDLVFLDIQMPGNNGFEVIEQVGASRMPFTVFVTAYSSYAVKAFEVHALDYLMKPIEPARLDATLLQVKERMAAGHARAIRDQLSALLESQKSDTGQPGTYPERLLVPNGTKDSFVKVSEIEWIEAADYYSLLHVGKKTFTLRQSIKQLARSLDPMQFVRIHRSAIVSLDCVKEIVWEGRGQGWVVLTGGQKVRMSKAGRESLLRHTWRS